MSDLAQSSPAAPVEELNGFERCLKKHFGDNMLPRVRDTFQKLGLPLPEKKTEFLDATEGALLFLDKYGVVVRIENSGRSYYYEDSGTNRVDQTPWVLQPLASVDVGSAIIEICPGCHVGEDEKDSDFLDKRLNEQDVWYWDPQICNGGRLPIKMPSFPEGVPVVIDRLAVQKLWSSTSKVADAIAEQQTAEAAAAQEQLYGPLRQIFTECWDSGKGMKAFWDACADHRQQGKLIAGWTDAPDEASGKTSDAKLHGEQYALRLQHVGRG